MIPRRIIASYLNTFRDLKARGRQIDVHLFDMWRVIALLERRTRKAADTRGLITDADIERIFGSESDDSADCDSALLGRIQRVKRGLFSLQRASQDSTLDTVLDDAFELICDLESHVGGSDGRSCKR